MPLSPTARNRREAAAAALAAGVLAAGAAAIDGAEPFYALVLGALAGGAAGSCAPGGGGERGARGRDLVWLVAALAAGLASASVVLAAGLALPAASALTRRGAAPWWRAGAAAGALGAAFAAVWSAEAGGAPPSAGTGAAAPWAIWALGAAWLALRAGWEDVLAATPATSGLGAGARINAAPPAGVPASPNGESGPEPERMGAQDQAADAGSAAEAVASARQSAADAEFLARAVHEIRNPLNAILTTVQILEGRMFGPLPEKYAEYVAIMGESGAYLQQLIQDVLDVSRIEAGSMPVTIERAEIAAVVRDTIAVMRAGAQAKGVELQERDLDEPFWIMADARAVRQIVFNLLGNAVKFTSAGGSVTCTLIEEGDQAVLQVEDEGPGFSPEALARLGEAFVQGGGAAARQAGAGLGLSIVAALAARHGGSLSAANRPDGGSMVAVRLPVHGPKESPDKENSE